MLKRCVAFSFAFFLFCLSLPFLLCCALLIKLDSKGPVLFRQTRMGRNFRPFLLLKLRTMDHQARGSAYTLGADPRITRFGRWLRKYKVDELPQLWNILRGDMNLVGPRPVVPALTYEFYRSYQQLLTVRPGITDPASLKYHRESEMLARTSDPLRYFKTVVTPDKLRLSTQYLRHASPARDLKLLLKTARVILPWREAAHVVSHRNETRETGTGALFAYAEKESINGD